MQENNSKTDTAKDTVKDEEVKDEAKDTATDEGKSSTKARAMEITEEEPKEVEPTREPTTEGGTKTYAFNDLVSTTVYNIRVSMPGKVTYCDYFKPAKGTVFTFRTTEDEENPDSSTVITLKNDNTQILRDTANANGADIYTNIDKTGQKNLSVGQEFKLRNYRVWQNITDGINNYFFEPDFNYEIISGSDVISYNKETSKITALKEGEALTLDNKKAAKSICKTPYIVDKKENSTTYLGTLVDIPESQFGRDITAAAYVIYIDKAGNEYTVYAQYPNGSTSVFSLLGNDIKWNEEW